MKECAAYGGVTAHSVMEAVYEHPQWIIDNKFWIILKRFYAVCSELTITVSVNNKRIDIDVY